MSTTSSQPSIGIGSDGRGAFVSRACYRHRTSDAPTVRRHSEPISWSGNGRYALGCSLLGYAASASAGSEHRRDLCVGGASSSIGRVAGNGQRCCGRVGCACRVGNGSHRYGSRAAVSAEDTGINCLSSRISYRKVTGCQSGIRAAMGRPGRGSTISPCPAAHLLAAWPCGVVGY